MPAQHQRERDIPAALPKPAERQRNYKMKPTEKKNPTRKKTPQQKSDRPVVFSTLSFQASLSFAFEVPPTVLDRMLFNKESSQRYDCINNFSAGVGKEAKQVSWS